MMRIGELARKVGITTQAIRYYERIGLLEKPARTPSGYRLYGQETVEFLQFVKKAQGLGFELKEIKTIWEIKTTGTRPCAYVVEQTEKKILEVQKKVRELMDFRLVLLEIERKWRTHKTLHDEDCTVCPLIEGLDKQQKKGGHNHGKEKKSRSV